MKNEKGFSLIEVMIAIGVSTILSLAFASTISYQYRSMTTVQALSDVTTFVGQVGGAIKDPTRSTNMLTKSTLTGTVKLLDPSGTGSVYVTTGTQQQPQDAWSVKTITFDKKTLTPTAGLYVITIGMDIQMNPKRTIGSPVIHRVIGDVYCLVTSNAITSCTGETDPTAQAMVQCQAMGGTWNVAAAFGTQCAYPQPQQVANNPPPEQNHHHFGWGNDGFWHGWDAYGHWHGGNH